MARRQSAEITSTFIPLVLTHVGRSGGDVEQLRGQFSLPEVAPGTPMTVPLAVYLSVCEAASRMLEDPYLGLNMARNAPRGFYGVMEFAARSAPTLGEALNRLKRYQRFINPSIEISQVSEGELTTIEHRIAGELGCGRHSNEFTIAMIVRLSRELTQTEISPHRVYFAHSAPKDISELIHFFGARCAIDFDRLRNGLVIDASLLSREVVSADEELLHTLDRVAAMLLPEAPPATTMLVRVREQVKQELRGRAPTLDDVAQNLRMSPRTLQRRLGEHHTSFHAVLDDVRRELAVHHLEHSALPLGEIAFFLGYSDTRAFLRAFRRWTRTTPQSYRRALRERASP